MTVDRQMQQIAKGAWKGIISSEGAAMTSDFICLRKELTLVCLRRVAHHAFPALQKRVSGLESFLLPLGIKFGSDVMSSSNIVIHALSNLEISLYIYGNLLILIQTSSEVDRNMNN